MAGIVGVAGVSALALTALGALVFIEAGGGLPLGDGTEASSAASTPAAAPVMSAAAADAIALSEAARTRAKSSIKWAEDGADAAAGWAQPRAQNAYRFAGRYEPRFEFRTVRKADGDETQIQLSLGRDSVKDGVPIQVGRLGFSQTPRRLRDKGHWFLFAAGGTNAVGLNILNSPSGELRRAGWSTEHVAAVGSGQAGVGWRRGALQLSFGAVERELSSYGRSINQKFLAFTLSWGPGAGGSSRGPSGGKAWMERDDMYNLRRH
jgi:hypothetical protein